MTDKEFRRLSRSDLIEVIYELQRNEKTLQDENAELKRQLEDRQLAISKAGSLAEVLATLTGLFDAAQETANGYVEQAQRLRLQAESCLSGAKRQADQLRSAAEQDRKRVLSQTARECRRLWALAEKGSDIPEFPSQEAPGPADYVMEGPGGG